VSLPITVAWIRKAYLGAPKTPAKLSTGNRTLVTAFVTILVGGALLVALEATVGIPAGWTALVVFFLLAVVGFALPQLYLARTDGSVAPRTRLRIVVVVMLVWATAAFSANTTQTELAGVWTMTVGIVLVIGARDFRDGYLASTLDSQ